MQQTISLYAAVGPDGKIIKSSVGPYKNKATTYTSKYRGYVVAKIGEIRFKPAVSEPAS